MLTHPTTFFSSAEAGPYEVDNANGFLLSNGAPSSAIAKIVFSTISESVITATCTSIINNCKSGGELKGYACGGADTGSAIDDLDYSDESSDTLGATVTGGGLGCGVASSDKMYRLACSTYGATNKIDDIDFSDDSSDTLIETMDQAMYGRGACHNETDGYAMGGGTNKIDKFVFSTELAANISATMPSTENSGAQGLFTEDKGYTMGSSSYETGIVDIDFSDDSVSTITETLDTGMTKPGGVNSGEIGIACGGATSGGPTVSNKIQVLTYAIESMSTDSETMTTSEEYNAGGCNEPT